MFRQKNNYRVTLQGPPKSPGDARSSITQTDKLLSGVMNDDTATIAQEDPGTAEQESSSRINSIFAQSILERVVYSWELIARNKDAVGLDFFARVLLENQDLLKLFAFGPDLAGQPIEKIKECKGLQAHATAVMNFVGRGVRGLSDIDSLIPDLRALGKTHVKANVSSAHYDMFFRHLMAAFSAELKGKWDQETASAWANIFNGMKTVMDQPEMLNQTEPLTGWGLGVAISSAFVALVAPVRLAGFLERLPYLLPLSLDCLELFAATILFGDMLSPWILHYLRSDTSPKRSRLQNNKGVFQKKVDKLLLPIKFILFRLVFSLHLERWVPWPRLDAAILLSYALQNLNRWMHQSSSLYAAELGVSYFYMIGLVRVLSVFRVSYFARCAENSVILKRTTTENWRMTVTITNLASTLLYVTHVSACIWCIVARVELGVGTTEPTRSEFFPEADLLMGGSSGALCAYLKAIYWAWVNLAGTGNVESVPAEPLEICTALLIHLCGATLFAIATGHVVTLLDQYTQKENQIGDDLAELRSFMEECGMSETAQDRIMRGYVTQHLLRGEAELTSVPDLKPDVGRRLPSHFRQDLELHAHAVALQRRNELLQDCSIQFLFALATGLKGTMMLLPGDYLFEEGRSVSRRFCMIGKGSLEIISGDQSVKTLERGCAIGLGWLIDATLPPKARASFPTPCELSDWLRMNGTAGVSIRATSDCILWFGFPSPLEVEALQRRFPRDFDLLESKRVARTAKVEDSPDVASAAVSLKRKKDT